MRIVQLTPGSGGSFYCENCLRDAALVRALRTAGHDVLMLPTYLPISAEADTAGAANAPVFFGGVNVYLQQKFAAFRRAPKWVDRLFDSPGLLKWAAGKAGERLAGVCHRRVVGRLEFVLAIEFDEPSAGVLETLQRFDHDAVDRSFFEHGCSRA